ncbi:Tetratricopeptide repeat-containing protein [Laceyella tengchongensis]|uniref:Tetratricopeptide repeat-containing protein n=1 Tax=Laceyella tengchongensis TaxID=574699 RepID=A0AA46ACY1_9BACL|nr:ATP-binding protein [Laceyella tengchongensis]SMP01484.1 Tetratricopeptide repeat-containing protein [Laceyella tengchongensis]
MKIEFKSNDFISREKELAQLIEIYEKVRQNETKFVILKADTGIGKTRLIQELYHYLTIADDENNYWPDNLEDTKHTMTIVPEFDSLETEKQLKMPWLWIALRCQNQDERNSYRHGTALSQIRKQVRLHLGGIIEKKRRNVQNINSIKGLIALLANYAFPGSGSIISIVSTLLQGLDQGISTVDSVKQLWSHWRSSRVSERDQNVIVNKQEYTSLVDQTIDIFSAILNKKSGQESVPLILVIDDAQWADFLTIEFLKRIIDAGKVYSWPLLILATCWESSLKEQTVNKEWEEGLGSFGQLYLYSQDLVDTEVIDLKKLDHNDIKKIVSMELKGLQEEAKEFIVSNCGGDLELLWDYIKRLKNTPGYLSKDGRLVIPLKKLNFRSNRKKELARDKILELGFSFACLLSWGSVQGIRFSKVFIEQCVDTFKDQFEVDINDFYKLDDPYNITKVEPHHIFTETAEFRRRLYYEVAREILEDMPQKEEIALLLIEFYRNVIILDQINRLDYSEQISIYEEFRYLVEMYGKSNSGLLELSLLSELKLLELYLQEGLFKRCLETGESLFYSNIKQWSVEEQKRLLGVLIEASFGIGDTDLEGKYIERYSQLDTTGPENKVDIQSYLYKSKYALRCNHMDEAMRFAEKAVSLVPDDQIDIMSYKCYEQLVLSYFYAGLNQKGLDTVRQLERKFVDFLNEHERLKVNFDHNIALLCHNIDANKEAISRNLSCKEGYLTFADRYHYMISCVNLADAYMAMGRLTEAEQEMRRVYEESKSSNWKHAHNIAAICLGNVLFMQDRLSEAFIYYEEGISISKQINHNWDALYGLIWRSFCLSSFGDPSSIDKLIHLKTESDKKGYSYLSSLSATFFLIASYRLRFVTHKTEEMLRSVHRKSTPGLYAQAVAAYLLTQEEEASKNSSLIEEMIRSALECEGVRGCPQIISEAVFRLGARMDICPELLECFKTWEKKYVKPIEEYKAELVQTLKARFGTEPKIKRCLMKCEALCCYDGVYLLDGEEEKLKETVKNYPAYFTHLPEEFVVDGNWRDLMVGRKTAVRPHQYQTDSYPIHFEPTRCVFTDENGLCSLQKVATDLDYHPWKFKPLACWAFPLRLVDGKITGPPEKDEQDPDYVDETYPGYMKFVPCGCHHDQGESWVELYKQEIWYLDWVLKGNNLR